MKSNTRKPSKYNQQKAERYLRLHSGMEVKLLEVSDRFCIATSSRNPDIEVTVEKSKLTNVLSLQRLAKVFRRLFCALENKKKQEEAASGFTHYYCLVFSVANNHIDRTQVTASELRKGVIDRINNLSDSEVMEACEHIETIEDL